MRLTLLFAFLLLPACSLFDNSDPREGVEPQEECVARFAKTVTPQVRTLLGSSKDELVPSFTYDVTKMDLEAMKVLMVKGSDQSAGSRLMSQTNIASTAIARFKAQPVDERGAFFLGLDPALYRVRGETMPMDEIVAAACERQQANMRLTDISWTRPVPETGDTETVDEADAATDNENNS